MWGRCIVGPTRSPQHMLMSVLLRLPGKLCVVHVCCVVQEGWPHVGTEVTKLLSVQNLYLQCK